MGVDEEPPPDWMLERYDEGTVSEGVILNRAFDRGGDVDMPVGDWKMLDPYDAKSYLLHGGRGTRDEDGEQFRYVRLDLMDATGQFTYEIPVGKGIVIRGHLDGIAELYAQKVSKGPDVKLGMRVPVEVKALGPDMLADWQRKGLDAFEGYGWQFSLAMYALGVTEGLFLVGEKLVEGKGDEREFKGIGKVSATMIDAPPFSLGKIKAKVAKIESLARGELPSCDKNAFPCPHFYLHDGETRGREEYNLPVVEAGNLEEELVDAITTYQGESLKVKQAESEKKGAKARLDKIVEELGIADKGGKVEMAVGTMEWKVEEVAGGTFERKAYVKRYPVWKAAE